jgi:hypothetical protein
VDLDNDLCDMLRGVQAVWCVCIKMRVRDLLLVHLALVIGERPRYSPLQRCRDFAANTLYSDADHFRPMKWDLSLVMQ